MKSEVLVRAREEEPDVQKMRQELTRAKSPTELSQINSLADFPIPKQIEDLMAKKTGKSIIAFRIYVFSFSHLTIF